MKFASRLFVSVLLAFAWIAPARAQVILPPTPPTGVSWTASATLPPYQDAAPLVTVSLVVDMQSQCTRAYENRSPAADGSCDFATAAATIEFSRRRNFSRLIGSAVQSFAAVSLTLPQFDGVDDFAGSSGTSHVLALSPSQFVLSFSVAPADEALYRVPWTLYARSSGVAPFVASGAFTVATSMSTSCEVDVVYN